MARYVNALYAIHCFGWQGIVVLAALIVPCLAALLVPQASGPAWTLLKVLLLLDLAAYAAFLVPMCLIGSASAPVVNEASDPLRGPDLEG